MASIEFTNDAQLKFKKNIDDLTIRLLEKITKETATAEFLVEKVRGKAIEGQK